MLKYKVKQNDLKSFQGSVCKPGFSLYNEAAVLCYSDLAPVIYVEKGKSKAGREKKMRTQMIWTQMGEKYDKRSQSS